MATDPVRTADTPRQAGVELRPARLETDSEEIAALMVEYLTEAIAQLQQEYGITESPTDLDAVSRSLGAYLPPNGLMIVVEKDAELIGVAALRTLTPGVVEVKRMYVAPQWQGHHLGSALLDRLLHESRETLGAKTVRLDTCRFMTAAQRLYQSRGFEERSPYEGTEIPEQMQKYWRFFERDSDRSGN
jgi:N-acetylglutamate synthase-like GNAT family acetyltransferase